MNIDLEEINPGNPFTNKEVASKTFFFQAIGAIFLLMKNPITKNDQKEKIRIVMGYMIRIAIIHYGEPYVSTILHGIGIEPTDIGLSLYH